jgi:hypothetical protein
MPYFLWQAYGANCLAPVYSGVTSAADKQAVVDAHNKLRRKVAKGQESRGNPGPQPSAANMLKIVSIILIKVGVIVDTTVSSGVPDNGSELDQVIK